MSRDVAAIVLAAGKGTRFRSDLAKVLHRAAGRSLIGHVLESLRPLDLAQTLVVVGHQRDAVAAEVDDVALPGADTIVQEEQLGTGHATEVALAGLADDVRQVLVVPGDTPLLTESTLRALLAAAASTAGAVLTAVVDDPTGYGRILRDDAGRVRRIVEHRDATDAERAVREVNAGAYVVDRALLAAALARVGDGNAQGERYLTDAVQLLTGDGHEVGAVAGRPDEIAGVNDRWQLAEAATVLRRRHLRRLAAEVGVNVADPDTTHVDVTVDVARDATLLPGTVLEGTTRVAEGAVVGPHSHLTDTEVGADATVHSTRAAGAVIGDRATVGPYTHLRPGTRLGADTKAGAYVEMKGAVLGDGTKVPHLAYLGDADVGARVNVGCGVITANFDGRTKSRTTIGDGVFIGCDVTLVAPVEIGEGAYVAAGSTVTDEVPADALAIARARQVVKDGWAAARRGD